MLVGTGLAGCGTGEAPEAQSWTGTWRSFWRDGQALMTLTQNGKRVTGTYQPGNGRIEGTRQGQQLVGQWSEGRGQGEFVQGKFVFSLSADGESFVGRFANGEYWNGERLQSGSYQPTPFTETDTPQNTLRSFVVALNAVFEDNVGASVVLPSFVTFAGAEASQHERNRRLRLLKRIIDLTTFRVREAPAQGAGARDTLALRTYDGTWGFPLQFVKTDSERWRVLVPEGDALRRRLRTGLDRLGFSSYGSFVEATRNSPRGVMRQFLQGVANWKAEGRAQALATLDLSGVSQQLQGIEGPLAADYLWQIIDRVGYVIWQEIPNDPDAREPYVHVATAAGSVVIAPVSAAERAPPEGAPAQDADAEGAVAEGPRWRFSASTVRDAAGVYEAIKELPLTTGGPPPEPLTESFRIRRTIRDLSPALMARPLGLANWQWAGIALALLLIAGVATLGGMLARNAGAWAFPVVAEKEEAAEEAEVPLRASTSRFAWPARLAIAGIVLFYSLRFLGLRQDLSAVLGTVAGLLATGGVVALLYVIVDAASHWFSHRRPFDARYLKPILIALVTGIVKVALVFAGILVAADIIGLPYEGVIAGLSVGGLALAIASQDTVSNFIGAGTLLMDQPFNQGDLIEVNGTLAHVQSVGIRSTRLRTLEDALLVVPNRTLADSTVNNLGKRRHRRIILFIGLTYDTPRAKVDAFVSGLRDTFGEQPLSEPEDLRLGLHEFSDSAYTIRLWGFLQADDIITYTNAQHRLMGDIIELAKAVGVSFAFPTRTLHMAPDDVPEPRNADGEQEPAA